ncbi:SsrA-binding protein [Candidatus Peregrinibacteria bacterium HGW-Peregrinibacteria-1]|jgi:SsrA-binding protein|nr:MAG: SsrA-binding protein [Candidatus Peregrinibacteria bacterium HGW-Peregrinibacteria-1]
MSYSRNKKAYHDYEILEEYEAGIVLNGDEVKSIKANQVNLKGAYIEFTEDTPYAIGIHISRYQNSSRKTHNPTPPRKLLLNRKEIAKISSQIATAGITAIPLELYPKGSLIKLKLGICRGKKLHDKRDTLRKKSQEMDIKRQIKGYE